MGQPAAAPFAAVAAVAAENRAGYAVQTPADGVRTPRAFLADYCRPNADPAAGVGRQNADQAAGAGRRMVLAAADHLPI